MRSDEPETLRIKDFSVHNRSIRALSPSGYGTPYDRFVELDGVPIVGAGQSSIDLETVVVAPWDRKGASGCLIDAGFQITNPSLSQFLDGYVLELPTRGFTKSENGIFEEVFYVVCGTGRTEFTWTDGVVEEVRWRPGALFSVPPNCTRRHRADDGVHARLLGVHSLPGMINLFRDQDFIFSNQASFAATSTSRQWNLDTSSIEFAAISSGATVVQLDQVSDVERLSLVSWNERGYGSTNRMFQFGENGLVAHVSEVPVGMYKKAHHHEGQGGVGGFILSPRGRGYTLSWDTSSPKFAEAEDCAKVEWRRNVLFHYDTDWFHQHFNTGSEPSRYLAIYAGSSKYPGLGYFRGREGVSVDLEDGGRQVSFEMESNEVFSLFEDALSRTGVQILDPEIWRRT